MNKILHRGIVVISNPTVCNVCVFKPPCGDALFVLFFAMLRHSDPPSPTREINVDKAGVRGNP